MCVFEPELREQGLWQPPREDPTRWTLGQLANVARKAGWFPSVLPEAPGEIFESLDGQIGDAFRFVERLRNMTVHPGAYVREELRPDLDEEQHMRLTYELIDGIIAVVFEHLTEQMNTLGQSLSKEQPRTYCSFVRYDREEFCSPYMNMRGHGRHAIEDGFLVAAAEDHTSPGRPGYRSRPTRLNTWPVGPHEGSAATNSASRATSAGSSYRSPRPAQRCSASLLCSPAASARRGWMRLPGVRRAILLPAWGRAVASVAVETCTGNLRPALAGRPPEVLPGLVAALELVHVPAWVERGRGDEHGLAVAGLVLAGREVVPEVAREVPGRIRRAVLEAKVDRVRAHAHQPAEGPWLGDVMQRGEVPGVVRFRQVDHGSLRGVEVWPGVPGCRSRRWRR